MKALKCITRQLYCWPSALVVGSSANGHVCKGAYLATLIMCAHTLHVHAHIAYVRGHR